MQQDLNALVAEHPFARDLGFRTVALAPGHAEITVALKPEHANFIGGVDGALIMCLLDHASTYAGSSVGKNVVGAQCSLNTIHPPLFEGELSASARVVHDDRRTVITEAEITDSRDKLVARGSYLHFVVD